MTKVMEMGWSMKDMNFRWAATLGFVVFVIFGTLIFYSASYSQVRIFLRNSPDIKSEFGDVHYSFLYVANIKNTHAKFLVYLIGEKKHASLAVRADKNNGRWLVSKDE